MCVNWLPFDCVGAGFYSGRFRLGFIDEEQEFWADYDEIWIVMRKQNRCYPLSDLSDQFWTINNNNKMTVINLKIKMTN